MNADLEETLTELGPAYRAVVDRLRTAAVVEPRPSDRRPPRRAFPRLGWTVGGLVAASLVLVCGLLNMRLVAPRGPDPVDPDVPQMREPVPVPANPYTLALAPSAADIREIVRTQSPDGSWRSDFLTQQNAAALRGVAGASIAYRKALRYLRTKGLSPLTDQELHARQVSSTRA